MRTLRIQRKRTRGWRMPPNTVGVTRPGLWSNPFVVGQPSGVFPEGMGFRGAAETLIASLTIEQCLSFYSDMIDGYLCPEMYPHGHNWMKRFHERRRGHPVENARAELRGKNLACFCALCDAHKDGKPFGVECSACAPCHADVLLKVANS